MNEYRVLEQLKNEVSMCYAEFDIGVNDDELEDPNNPAYVNIVAIMEYLQPRLRRGDMRLGVTIMPASSYVYNFTSFANKAWRAIHVTCNLDDCIWEGNKISDEQRYGIWRQSVIEVIRCLMTFLSQEDAKVHFRGPRESVFEIHRI